MFPIFIYSLVIALIKALTHDLNLNLEKHEVDSHRRSNNLDGLPTCKNLTVCATLQKTIRSWKINPICNCGKGQYCPPTWDSENDQTITHGTKQYKFCSKFLREIRTCKQSDVAYAVFSDYLKSSGKLVTKDAHLLCLCPEETHHLKLKNVTFEFKVKNIRNEYYFCEKGIAPQEELPICKEHSFCAFLQKNVMGLNIKPMCSCPGGNKCPLSWNSEDGKSVLQGDNQYKFCTEVSLHKTCDSLQVAYTTSLEYLKSTNKLIAYGGYIRCICPKNYGYKRTTIRYFESSEKKITTRHYSCQKMNTCSSIDICQTLHETTDAFFIQPICNCPGKLSCPIDSDTALKTEDSDGWTTSTVRCEISK